MTRRPDALPIRFEAVGPRRPPDYLARVGLTLVLALGSSQESAEAIYRGRWPDDEGGQAVLKAATSPTSTTGSGAALAVSAVADFIESLRPQSAAAELIARGNRVSLAGLAQVSFPRRQGQPNANLAWVAEAGAIPVRSYQLEGATVGPPKKLAAIAALTEELARSASGEAAISVLLREDASASLDGSLFSNAAASATRPAGIMNGIAALSATSGGGQEAMATDLANLASAASAAGTTDLIYIAAPAQALAASIRLVGPNAPPVIPSAALAAGTVLAVAPSAFVSAFDAEPRLDAVNEGTLVFEDTNPTDIGVAGSPNVVAAPVRSLFQADAIAVRLLLPVAWTLRSAGGVAWLTGATW